MPPSSSRLRISGPATTARKNPLGLLGSVLLHGGIVAATFFSFAHTLDMNIQDVPLVPVELVTITDTTNITAQSPEPPKPEPQETPPAQDVTPPPPVPEKAEVAPDAPKVVEKKPPPPVAKPKPDKPKEEKFDINSIVALLDKKNPPPKNQAGKPGDHSIKGMGQQTAMTMDVMTALQSQIYRCYNVSSLIGAPKPDDLIVDFDVFLNPDGSVAQPPQLAAKSNSGSSYTQAAVEAARRAISACAPYKLPANKYDQWRNFTFHFDPRPMMGQ